MSNRKKKNIFLRFLSFFNPFRLFRKKKVIPEVVPEKVIPENIDRELIEIKKEPEITLSKIALLLPGHLRSYRECLPNLEEKLLRKYNIDVFIHTWDKGCFRIPTYMSMDIQEEMKGIKDLYLKAGAKNVFIKVEDYESFMNSNEEYISLKDLNPNSMAMYLKLRRTNDLKKEIEEKYNSKYDFCIRSRPDLKIIKDINIDTNLDFLSFGKVPNACRFCVNDDKFYFGPDKLMNMICDITKEIPSIRKNTEIDKENLVHAHNILDWYCKWKNIPYNYTFSEMDSICIR